MPFRSDHHVVEQFDVQQFRRLLELPRDQHVVGAGVGIAGRVVVNPR